MLKIFFSSHPLFPIFFNKKLKLVELDRDNEDNELEVVRGASRTRINAWLPLFINEHHWKYCRRFAKDAISVIGVGVNNCFTPQLALSVFSKLLIQTLVNFTVFGDMSDRTLQQCCDVYRVFVQMAKEHPDVSSFFY